MASHKTTAYRKQAPKPKSWKAGQSGNPKGAPKRGESWAEIIRSVGDMTGEEVADKAAFLAKEFRQLPKHVTLKVLTVMRVYAALINEPQPGLLNAFMDRAEGSVAQKIEGEGLQTIVKVIYEGVGDSPASAASEAIADRERSTPV